MAAGGGAVAVTAGLYRVSEDDHQRLKPLIVCSVCAVCAAPVRRPYRPFRRPNNNPRSGLADPMSLQAAF